MLWDVGGHAWHACIQKDFSKFAVGVHCSRYAFRVCHAFYVGFELILYANMFRKVSECRRSVSGKIWFTHRPLSSSFLGLPYRILNINHKKELLRGLWFRAAKRG